MTTVDEMVESGKEIAKSEHPAWQVPFRRMTLGEQPKIDSFTIRMNEAERALLDDAKKLLKQEKDSTAMKQCLKIATVVLHEQKMAAILDIVAGNKRRNERTGAMQAEEA